MEEWRALYQLPPKDVFFKLLDTRSDLITHNYATRREQTWDQILRQAQHTSTLPPPTASTDCSFRSDKSLPPLNPKRAAVNSSIRRSSANPITRENSYKKIYEEDALPAMAKPRRASVRRQRPTVAKQ